MKWPMAPIDKKQILDGANETIYINEIETIEHFSR
jgi:hypothetical protein